jgi:trigger factor
MPVKSTVETLSPARVRLTIEVPFDELQTSTQEAFGEATLLDIAGFRKGRLPFQAIDRRAGATVLPQVVEREILQQILAASREHNLKLLGRSEVDIVDFGSGRPLTFTALVDVRRQFDLPQLSSIVVEIDPIVLDDDEINARIADEIETLRERLATFTSIDRPVAKGDFVQLDLSTTCDDMKVEGGPAGEVTHEVGSGRPLADLGEMFNGSGDLTAADEEIVGMSPNDRIIVPIVLSGAAFDGREAEVVVTIKAASERQLPELDDQFAKHVGNCETINDLRAKLRERLILNKRAEAASAVRNKALKELATATAVSAPEDVIRDEVGHHKAWMRRELERAGTDLREYLSMVDMTEGQIDAALTEVMADRLCNSQVLDALGEAEQIVVSDEEVANEIVYRAQRAGVATEAYFNRLVQAGEAGSIHGDVRRAKALALVMNGIVIKDTDGKVLTPDDLGAAEQRGGHDQSSLIAIPGADVALSG